MDRPVHHRRDMASRPGHRDMKVQAVMECRVTMALTVRDMDHVVAQVLLVLVIFYSILVMFREPNRSSVYYKIFTYRNCQR